MDWILTLLHKDIRRFKTANPFEIAASRHILVRSLPLGETLGFYMKHARHQVITLNSDMEEYKRVFTCSHELAHAVIHPNENTPFLNANTLRSRGKIETQAHYWATAETLIYHGADPKDYETTELMLLENGIPYEMNRFKKFFTHSDEHTFP